MYYFFYNQYPLLGAYFSEFWFLSIDTKCINMRFKKHKLKKKFAIGPMGAEISHSYIINDYFDSIEYFNLREAAHSGPKWTGRFKIKYLLKILTDLKNFFRKIQVIIGTLTENYRKNKKKYWRSVFGSKRFFYDYKNLCISPANCIDLECVCRCTRIKKVIYIYIKP